jgi:hypothetical protein
LVAAAFGAFAFLGFLWPQNASAQPKFGFEVEGGRNVGLTPYLRNIVVAERELLGDSFDETRPFRPYLGDEESGWGTHLELRFITRGIYGSLSVRWFSIDESTVHHRGYLPNHDDNTLRSTRVRPDGTVDDAAVDYRPLEGNIPIPLSEPDAANLLVLGLNGGYRFYVYEGPVDIFLPVGGGLVLTHVTRPREPWRPGLEARAGVGAAFKFSSLLSLVVQSQIHGMATAAYGRRSDSARRAAETGGGTGAAFFSTMIYPSFDVSLRFTIR